METKTVDARGMACPLPVVNAKKASEEMTQGGTLTVLVDNEIAVQNLTKFGNSKSFTVSSEKKAEKNFAVTFQQRSFCRGLLRCTSPYIRTYLRGS